MAAIYVVEDCIKEAVEVLKKCRHRCSKTRKSKIAANFKCWLGNCLRSKIRTKWTCRVRPNHFENRIVAVDELSSSKMLKGLIVVKFNCLVLAQCIAALNINDVIDRRVYGWEKVMDLDFTFEPDVTVLEDHPHTMCNYSVLLHYLLLCGSWHKKCQTPGGALAVHYSLVMSTQMPWCLYDQCFLSSVLLDESIVPVTK